MTRPVIIAVDAGGTLVKAIAFDLAGKVVAHQTADVQTTHYPDGRVERDGAAFWRGTALALRRVVAELEGCEIRAVGCTGFGNGVFFVDECGAATRPGIVSVDHRAQHVVDGLSPEGRLRFGQITGQKLWGGQTIAQIVHLVRREPEVLERTRWALCCKDFIRMQLTGEALTDPTDASGGGLMDVSKRCYARSVLQFLDAGAAEALLPDMVASDAIGGRVTRDAAEETGLPEGTPVAGSMMDVAACALGTGAVGADILTMIAGTWSINSVETDGSLDGPERPLLNMLYRDRGHLVAEGSPCSAANLSWYLDHALGGRVTLDEANALVAASPVNATRCQFLPYVFGPAPRRGAFLGLGAGDNDGSMLRALFEGVAFQHRLHAVDAVDFAGREMPEVIRLAGGAAKSPVWARIFADVCDRPVEVVEAPEVGALGAAICAAVACGSYASFEEAVDQMVTIAARHAPDPAHRAISDDRYQEFLRLSRLLSAEET